MKRATQKYVCVGRNYRISIHALVKRATFICYNDYNETRYFNPRPREEGDGITVDEYISEKNFNPRPREEGDVSRKLLIKTIEISIHALVKRATKERKYCVTDCQYFNPRPREEGDLLSITILSVIIHFNPRPREEGDRQKLIRMATQNYFNPRPREEGDGKA